MDLAVLVCVILCSVTIYYSTGECLFEGKLYMNHTLWMPTQCTICTCQDPVSMCEDVRCTSPYCHFSKGEYLQIPSDDCCPECVRQLSPCQYKQQTIPHNHIWNPELCSECTCYDGEVRCSAVICPDLRCNPGEVTQSLSDQCCPQCVPAGRSCTFDGEEYADGTDWSPIPCTKCMCRDGHSTCYPVCCPPLVCPQEKQIETHNGECCPKCVGMSCTEDGRQYKDGDQWKKDACTYCVCVSGKSICRTKECVKELECGKNERNVTRAGECCEECILREDGCLDEDPVRYSGEIWNISRCEFCICLEGNVNCHTAVCEHVNCRENEKKILLDGKCCPECVEVQECHFTGEVYLDGDTWQPDPCTVCDCSDGDTICYHIPCPVCPEGSVSVVQPGQCCGKCQILECSDECANCKVDDTSYCTACKTPGLLLLDGDCVQTCRDGTFPSHDLRHCQDCHESCYSCSGETRHHCTTCKPGSLWKEGQCVRNCGINFYQDNGQCLNCHTSCSTCTGPSEDHCLSCSNPEQVLLSGRCLDSCGSNYYIKDRMCKECQPTCRTCSSDGLACTSCYSDMVLYKGQCLSDCPKKYYLSQLGHCTACHPSCHSCLGPKDTDCTSCIDGVRLSRRGRCRMPCPNGQYLKNDGRCEDCEFECSKCHTSDDHEESVCTQCVDPSMVAFDNICVRECPIGRYAVNNICQGCGIGCLQCHSPVNCTRCGPSLYISGGTCVKYCSVGQFIEMTSRICTDCSENCLRCMGRDKCTQCNSRSYLKNGVCVSFCGDGYYQNDKTKTCDENRFPPKFEINGQIQIEEGGIIDIPVGIFVISDKDTPVKDLLFILIQPPTNGQLVKIIRGKYVPLQQANQFSVMDIESGIVRFMHNESLETKGTVILQVSDRLLNSEEKTLSIQAVSKIPPMLLKNKPLVVTSGETTVINSDTVDVKLVPRPGAENSRTPIYILQGPSHGIVVHKQYNSKLSQFMIGDLRSGNIGYQHDDRSKAVKDFILLRVSDGYNQLHILVEIQIRRKDDVLPMLVQNGVGNVANGNMLKLTPDLLMAKVMDKNKAPSSDIIYTLVPTINNPKYGDIMMIVPTPLNGPGRGWEDMGDGKMAAKMFRFMQRDIDEGRIWYKHKGSLSAKSDSIKFEVADTSVPPNILRDQTFQISIIDEPTETATPTIAPGVRLGMTVLENQVVPISSANLAYVDVDTPDRDIIYTITTPLGDEDGTVEHVDMPFQPVFQFNQEDINNNRILYRPPLQEIGASEREVFFTFIVSDGRLERQPEEQRFVIRIIPVNNMPPRFLNAQPTLSVSQGGVVPISDSLIAVTDSDTPESELQVTLTTIPVHGSFEKNHDGGKIIIRQGESFMYEELLGSVFQYRHDGSETPLVDSLRLEVSDGSHPTSVTVNINIIRVDKQAPYMLPTAVCRVTVKEGGSIIIQRKDLGFKDDDDTDDLLRITLTSDLAHGKMIYNSGIIQKGSFFTQADINTGQVNYTADREIGIQPITEILVFNVSDASGNILPNQILSVVIEPEDNQSPVVRVGPNLEVEEGGEVAITAGNLHATDPDSPVSNLIVVIKTLPSFGQIHAISPEVQGSQKMIVRNVQSFPVQDMLDGNIYYIQNDHKNKEPVMDGIQFIVTDGINESPVQRMNISIKLTNDEAPVLITEQLFVREDHSVLITNSSLYVLDIDTPPNDLIFTLDTLPQHGTVGRKNFIQDSQMNIKILQVGQSFTYQDVLEDFLLYTHNGGIITSDSFTLSITDGLFTDTGTLNVVIGMIDDETPRMTINRGLQIQSGTTTPIKSKDLKAADLDSDDLQIIYTIKRDPAIGQLQLNKNGDISKVSRRGPVSTFTQADINAGYLEYAHVTREITGVVTFKFDVADPEGNYLIDQIFFITVIEDRNPPRVVTNQELVVTEGSHARLTTNHLSFMDVDSETGTLRYFLLSAPELGHLEYSDTPGVPISEFTQSDLAAGNVIFVHTSPKEVYVDKFTFTVTDGTNEVTQTFSIVISPVDDEIPIVVNNGLVVQEGIRKIITEFELKAYDKDTKEDSITFYIVNPPVHGSLDILQDDNYVHTTSFTMADIFENKISYQHDGTETRADNFMFTVNDGSNTMFAMQRDDSERGDINIPQTEPINFEIDILPLDDGSPVLETNLGLQFLEHSDQLSYNIITSRELMASDIDTEPNNLVFVVTKVPQHGVLENTANPTVAIQSFTQEDINNKVIRYVLTSDVQVVQDSFTFDLLDTKPNRVPGNVFHIMWSVIGFEMPMLNITETAGVIRVPVIRKGNQKQYSIVTCSTSPGTATSEVSRSRPGTQDYVHQSGQVQFDEWQNTKVCSIIINDDSLYEGPETFNVELLQPTYALLGPQSKASVTIYDLEDEPVIQFKFAVYHVNETDGTLSASLVRTGDVDSSVSVICYSLPLTAKGSSQHGLESGSDYISRQRTNSYRVVFPQGSTEASCDVKLIDDSLFESAEQFELVLSDPSLNARIGPSSKAVVIIEGPNDVSTIHLSLPRYHFDEDVGDVEIEIIREGSDLSHNSLVWCATRMAESPTAMPGEDYIPSSSHISFEPGQKSETCRLTILDDDMEPKLEGNETFVIFLSSPSGSILVEPYYATVDIHDHHLDLPSMEFEKDHYFISEPTGVVNVTIVRTGDISYPSSVICYTRQNTAQVMMDYIERTLTEESRIFFQPGQKTSNCTVYIVNDKDYEPDEIFYLRLSDPMGNNEGCDANIGEQDITTITILNEEDVPTIQFEQAAYSIDEPSSSHQVAMVTVYVIRTGDLSHTSSVRCSTRDGSAISGNDYSPRSQVLEFKEGQEFLEFPIEILYNSELEWHEAFSVMLGPEDPDGAVLGPITSTTINILDDEASGSLVLPAPPVVVSLLYYDDVDIGLERSPSPGYPLVCVSPCDIHYPEYGVTHSLCAELGINQSTLLYRWEVAIPNDDVGSRSSYVLVSDNTVYTDTNRMVLDSIYFRPSFKVRCVAQPIHKNGNPGIPLKSQSVEISQTSGICNAPIFSNSPHSYGAQSFLAKLNYVGPDDIKHPNTIHISIRIPHQDGYLPLISTYPLHNLRFVLSEPIYRQQHLCSNLILPEERNGIVDSGFLDNYHLYPPSHNFAYQFEPKLRGNKTLMLYRHLNLKSCLWTFDAWYHMTDLVDLCGGKIISDFQIKDAGQTYLTVKVPLYVYYVYTMAPTGWGSLQHHSEMEFSFYYDTVLWKSGLETDGKIAGDLQVLKVLVGRDGKLIIDFKTQAKFRGLYVLSHHTEPEYESRVIPPDGMAITFNLTQLWCQPTYDSPHQLWRAASSFNLKDYTGVYTFEMIPCRVRSTESYTGQTNLPIPCTAQEPQRFEVPIAFQQSNRPVPVIYSLDTEFHLTNNRNQFLSAQTKQNSDDDGLDTDTTFSEGEKIYGRVFWSPEQDLEEAYKLSIEKVYLCTGSNGFIPTYDPTGKEYGGGPQFGCIQPSPNLKYRFLILDRGARNVEEKAFNNVPFNAKFANDDPHFANIESINSVDGFVMDVDPLYKVSSGHQWYLQVIYIIGKSDTSRHRYHRKRSVDKRELTEKRSIIWKANTWKHGHHNKRSVDKRDMTEKHEIVGKLTKTSKRNGTNIIHIKLNTTTALELDTERNPSNPLVIILISIIIPIFVLILFIIFIIIYRRRRRKTAKPKKQNNIEITRQNSFQSQNLNFASATKRLSQINVNVTEIKNLTVEKTGKDVKSSVKIKNTNIHTQGKKNKNSGTEV